MLYAGWFYWSLSIAVLLWKPTRLLGSFGWSLLSFWVVGASRSTLLAIPQVVVEVDALLSESLQLCFCVLVLYVGKSCHRSHFSCSLQSLCSSAVVGAAALPLQHLKSHAVAVDIITWRISCSRTRLFSCAVLGAAGALSLHYLKSSALACCRPLHEELLQLESLQLCSELLQLESLQLCSGGSSSTFPQ